MTTKQKETVQDYFIGDLLENDSQDTNETVQLLEFVRDNSVPLTKSQMQSMLLLRENDLEDIGNYMMAMRSKVLSKRSIFDLISKLTLADRIKGNAKLSHLLKASANPAGSALKPEDVQAKGMSKNEIDK